MRNDKVTWVIGHRRRGEGAGGRGHRVAYRTFLANCCDYDYRVIARWEERAGEKVGAERIGGEEGGEGPGGFQSTGR